MVWKPASFKMILNCNSSCNITRHKSHASRGDSIFQVDSLIVRPRPHPSKPAASFFVFFNACDVGIPLCYNATPQNTLCLKDSISQCNWCSPWDADDETPCSGVNLGAIKLASSESRPGAEQTLHEKALSWNNCHDPSVCVWKTQGHGSHNQSFIVCEIMFSPTSMMFSLADLSFPKMTGIDFYLWLEAMKVSSIPTSFSPRLQPPSLPPLLWVISDQ